VLVDGDPLADLGILVDPDRIALVMKEGTIYKNLFNQQSHHSALVDRLADEASPEAVPA
jgi:hypothetical protein